MAVIPHDRKPGVFAWLRSVGKDQASVRLDWHKRGQLTLIRMTAMIPTASYHPKDILAKRPGERLSRRMNYTPKTPNLAKFRRGLELLLTETPPTKAPKHLFRTLFPRNPVSPPSGPAQWLFRELPAKSNFLQFNIRAIVAWARPGLAH